MAALLLLLPLLGIQNPSAAQRKSDEILILKDGASQVGNLTGGATKSYRVELLKGEYLHVDVEQRGIDVVIGLLGPRGAQLAEADALSETIGSEELSHETAESGLYLIEVRAQQKAANAGSFRIGVKKARWAVSAHRARIAAERLFLEGKRGYGNSSDNRSRESAIQKYEQALAKWREAGDRRWEGRTHVEMGRVYSALNRFDRALNLGNEALRISREVKDKITEGQALNGLGLASMELSNYEDARRFLDQAAEIMVEIHDTSGAGATENALGMVHMRLSQYDKALESFTRALTIGRQARIRSGEAATLVNLGFVYERLGEYGQAQSTLGQALSNMRNANEKAGEAATLVGLGRIHSALHQYKRAQNSYRLALLLWRQTDNRSGEGGTLNYLGQVYTVTGQYAKAQNSLETALLILRQVGDKSGEGDTFTNLMLNWQRRRSSLAIFYGKQAVNAYQAIRGNIKHLEKESQRSFLGAHETSYRILADLLISEGRLPEAEQVLAMLKEEEFFDYVRGDDSVVSSLLKRASLTTEETEALARYNQNAEQLTALGSEYAALEEERKALPPDQRFLKQGRLDELDKVLADSRDAFRLFLHSLNDEFGNRDERVVAVESGLQKDLRAWGAHQTAVISTIVGKQRSHSIVTTATAQRAHTMAVTEVDLNKLIAEFRQAVTHRTVDPRPSGQKLYDLLIKPIETDLQGMKAKTLVWSLDGALRYVPLAALYDAKQGYLAQRYQNVVITLASRTNLGEQPLGKEHWQALGAGVSKAYSDSNIEFAALREVPAELSGIIRQAEIAVPGKSEDGVVAGRRLLDEQFTYSALKTYLGRYPLVHIASHFSFRPGNESNSFLLLGGGTASERKLTIANIRRANTIFNGVQLLTLSACDTGTGGVAADGREIESFGVIAQEQGAKAVLATLWPVADPSTREFMVAFYRLLAAPVNPSKAEALRLAQLTLLRGSNQDVGLPRTPLRPGPKASSGASPMLPYTPDPNAKYSHPYYWAPFILIGNWK